MTTTDHDLVVLSLGMVPGWDPEGRCAVAKGSDGFIKNVKPKIAPTLTNVKGIFVTGVAAGPKDIVDTIAEAGASAMEASRYLASSETGKPRGSDSEPGLTVWGGRRRTWAKRHRARVVERRFEADGEPRATGNWEKTERRKKNRSASPEGKVGVYICHCGGNISDHVDVEKVCERPEGPGRRRGPDQDVHVLGPGAGTDRRGPQAAGRSGGGGLLRPQPP